MPSNLNDEKKLRRKGYKRIAGLDEVGRGGLCGPVVAAAVLADSRFKISDYRILRKIKDSKKLSAKKRQEFYKILTNHPKIRWGTGRVYQKMIDRINILEATKLAMERAIGNLEKRIESASRRTKSKVDYLILDGNMKINLAIPQRAIVKADEKVFSCAAASIIAKVQRDRLMCRYHKKYPDYGFDKHKGYGTRYHLAMLKKHGLCKLHRQSFRPVNLVA
jgi:ribonuclease HII